MVVFPIGLPNTTTRINTMTLTLTKWANVSGLVFDADNGQSIEFPIGPNSYAGRLIIKIIRPIIASSSSFRIEFCGKLHHRLADHSNKLLLPHGGFPIVWRLGTFLLPFLAGVLFVLALPCAHFLPTVFWTGLH